MLLDHDLENINLMIDRAESFEREFMRDYVKMEIDMFKHQCRKRALTHDENIAFHYATKILARLESQHTRRNPLPARRNPDEQKQLYIYRH
jgi:hypothetical protein